MEISPNNICALTMVRNDDFFLRKWVEYYGAQLGRENLYIFFDGRDQIPGEFCNGTNVASVDHANVSVHEGDRLRSRFLSQKAAELFLRYDAVIGTDVDEFIVPDPASGHSLPEFIEKEASYCRYRFFRCISPLGVDVGQNLREEGPVDGSAPFVGQRRYAKLSTRYSKASILLRPAVWGSGFHRVKGHNFHIAKDLYLFHFGCVDLDRIKAKLSDEERVREGWSRHLDKRAKTIKLVSEKEAVEWETAVRRARVVQNIFRPPYAWNKPAMFEADIVVRIPERFIGKI